MINFDQNQINYLKYDYRMNLLFCKYIFKSNGIVNVEYKIVFYVDSLYDIYVYQKNLVTIN